ncbi:hypothetical protein HNQ65_000408 [Prosthecobacter vanneervenii]|uniref:Uncharacterized protein n=1 Tax=Prosthecobacter vanneervenii TaxID=48466 RepID=A0A7W7Y765_9BACT|nr:hypothetical protein [Prosthecobacter vanneervenii]
MNLQQIPQSPFLRVATGQLYNEPAQPQAAVMPSTASCGCWAGQALP